MAGQAPKVCHLLFADDSILFRRASVREGEGICTILGLYAKASGKIVNFLKSSFTFSPNVRKEVYDDIQGCLGLSAGPQTHDKYLGLSSFIGKDKRRTFSGLKERGQKKLKLWSSKVFSIGGQKVLIKAVAQLTATYSMSTFKIPTTLCNVLQALVATFWWGGLEDCRKIHLTHWEKLCRPKNAGGMGFRDLSYFN